MKLRFVYAVHGEPVDPAGGSYPILAPFNGIEIDWPSDQTRETLGATRRAGFGPSPRPGTDSNDGLSVLEGLQSEQSIATPDYVLLSASVFPAGDVIARARVLRQRADAEPTAMMMFETDPRRADVRAAWQLMEAVGRPNVKLAWPADAAERPAIVVPTLNLRIGLLRVTTLDDKARNFVKRLAGIGSAAFIVIDPPAGDDRPAAALAIAQALYETVVPPRPVKAKPAVALRKA